MIFEELKENYTKVSYKGKVREEIVLPKDFQLVDVKREEIEKRKAIIKQLIRVGMLVGFTVFSIDTFAMASSLSTKAEELYFDKFIDVAKWVIIIKGGWDTVIKALKEDFEGMKKTFISYLIVFVILLGLPFALNEVESFFRG